MFLSRWLPAPRRALAKAASLLALVMLLLSSGDLMGQSRGNFKVTNTSVTSEAVQFDYYAPYPGMTKVLLFDDTGKMVWRGQYIDQEGDNTLRLRASYLNAGRGYVFQFEYKLEKVRIPVVGP